VFGDEESAFWNCVSEGDVEGVDVDEDEIDGIGGRDGGGGTDGAVEGVFEGLRTFQGRTLSSVDNFVLVFGVNDKSCTAM